jgi:hypothetical protein
MIYRFLIEFIERAELVDQDLLLGCQHKFHHFNGVDKIDCVRVCLQGNCEVATQRNGRNCVWDATTEANIDFLQPIWDAPPWAEYLYGRL